MSNLILLVPADPTADYLQIYTDYATLARIWSKLIRFQCPQCGTKHETEVGSGLPSNRSSSDLIKRNA
jgi:hypothetical protein